ncbi:hypothetical protein DUI87_04686 [Hirundo rustica rustica]|uniref:Uncharacterized protein n=1 Tax=Hirundo rustica rustica TaxID=333673 RepID=A0A3M0L6Y4_HIRRU|nr:hypothetical protein DUI87_04686 [Hirundo rustica rustica]
MKPPQRFPQADPKCSAMKAPRSLNVGQAQQGELDTPGPAAEASWHPWGSQRHRHTEIIRYLVDPPQILI